MGNLILLGAMVVMAWQITYSSPICRACTKQCYQNGSNSTIANRDALNTCGVPNSSVPVCRGPDSDWTECTCPCIYNRRTRKKYQHNLQGLRNRRGIVSFIRDVPFADLYKPTDPSAPRRSPCGYPQSIFVDAHTYHSTNTTDLLEYMGQANNRRKREADVEFRACSRFQVEMLLIPLSIAMIPIILCALIACTCCCGPEDSRGKLPEDFLSSFPMSKKRSQMNSEDMELEFRDGYVQRKNSARTKFSTVVSYIEARRESQLSTRTEGDGSIHEETMETTEQEQKDNPAPSTDQLRKTPSLDSNKKTRFSDTVSVISVESLCRR